MPKPLTAQSALAPVGVAASPSARSRVGGRSARVLEQVAQAVIDELRESGLSGLSVPRIAQRAGVHTATIYRRWSSNGALIAFAAGYLAERALPVPDTGSLRGDLRAMLRDLRAFLEGSDGATLVAAAFAFGDSQDVQAAQQLYWRERVISREPMFNRARLRGDVDDRDAFEDLIEMAVGPLYVRRYISRRMIDDVFIERVVDAVLSDQQ